MKYSFFFIAFISLLLTIGYWIGPKVGIQIGSYLVVNEKFENVEYIISNRLSSKVLNYLRSGKAKFIIIAVSEETNEVWRAYFDRNAVRRIREKADKLGIPQEKIIIYKKTAWEVWDGLAFYKHVLVQMKAKSAVFIAQFYHTRTVRFFLDEYFEESDIKTYVQHENQIDTEDYDQWWRKTTYANLFLEEYLTIGFYFINKLLWTRTFY
jgi:hypothetical protein